ncbi:hypothetical protein NQ176_g2840 [Zarea fungicola]|uniref:Uncharacterized protein n=1 Tax=Zarea fungicola TaxID=93591 RepID=A0ACC1NMF9_9HYPO|nr:hypothetical protein NQ176_g2840 [Lecanicillium fungicola]
MAAGKDFGVIRDLEQELVKKYINWLPLRGVSEFRDAAMSIRQFCRDLVKERKEHLLIEKQKKKSEQHQEADILSVALQSGHFSDDGLPDQLMTFFAAGHESRSVSLT